MKTYSGKFNFRIFVCIFLGLILIVAFLPTVLLPGKSHLISNAQSDCTSTTFSLSGGAGGQWTITACVSSTTILEGSTETITGSMSCSGGGCNSGTDSWGIQVAQPDGNTFYTFVAENGGYYGHLPYVCIGSSGSCSETLTYASSSFMCLSGSVPCSGLHNEATNPQPTTQELGTFTVSVCEGFADQCATETFDTSPVPYVSQVSCFNSVIAIGQPDSCNVQISYGGASGYIGTVSVTSSSGTQSISYTNPSGNECIISGGECNVPFTYSDSSPSSGSSTPMSECSDAPNCWLLSASLNPTSGVSFGGCLFGSGYQVLCNPGIFVGSVSTTTVSCSPAIVTDSTSTTCTATVSGGSSTEPTGTVSFQADGFSPSDFSPNPCTLPTSGTISCSVEFSPSESELSSYPTAQVTAFYSGDSNYLGSNGLTNVGSCLSGNTVPCTSMTTVSCSPTSMLISDSSSITCTATVIGNPSYPNPTGTVTFSGVSGYASSSDFTPNNPCTLPTSGTPSCTVTFSDPHLAGPSGDFAASGNNEVIISVYYSGDSNYQWSGGGTSVAACLTTSSCETALQSGTTSLESTNTGISVTLSNYYDTSATITLSTINYMGTPPVPKSIYVQGTYYDVQVTGISDGQATVCFPFTGTPPAIIGWYNSVSNSYSYFPSSSVTYPPGQACVTLPVSDLSGTVFVIAPSTSPVTPEFPFGSFLALATPLLAVLLFFFYVRKKKGSTFERTLHLFRESKKISLFAANIICVK